MEHVDSSSSAPAPAPESASAGSGDSRIAATPDSPAIIVQRCIHRLDTLDDSGDARGDRDASPDSSTVTTLQDGDGDDSRDFPDVPHASSSSALTSIQASHVSDSGDVRDAAAAALGSSSPAFHQDGQAADYGDARHTAHTLYSAPMGADSAEVTPRPPLLPSAAAFSLFLGRNSAGSSIPASGEVGGSSGRRCRWDQAPSRCHNCPTGGAQRIMTCCRVVICRDCAVCNPCGCRQWQEGLGYPVPLLPRYEVPEECLLERLVLLPRPRWQLFYTSRVGAGDVWYWFYSVEDAYHGNGNVLYQFHRYETVGRHWTRFHCLLLVIPEGRIGYFSAPFTHQDDIEFIWNLLAGSWRHH